MLFQLIDRVIGDDVALRFGQTLPLAAHDLDGAAQSEGNPIAQYVASNHGPNYEQNMNTASRYS